MGWDTCAGRGRKNFLYADIEGRQKDNPEQSATLNVCAQASRLDYAVFFLSFGLKKIICSL